MKFNTVIQKLNMDCNDNVLYMKRDDLIPFSFGGNKARKAAYFFEDILKKNCDAVVTYGSSSSNHCRIISNMAAMKKMKCYIISPEDGYCETYNSKMVEMFGAQVIKTPLERVSTTIDELMDKLSHECKPYFIYGGGHGNLGTEAYVDAYKEICEYESANKLKFDYIFHASGTGTTQAGLVAGKLINKNDKQKIVGISIARKCPYGKDVIIKSMQDYFHNNRDYSDVVYFDDSYVGDGYGAYHSGIAEMIKSVLRNDGIALNATYTGKAFWGMCEHLEKNNISGKKILFINTGGSPLFFDFMEELKK